MVVPSVGLDQIMEHAVYESGYSKDLDRFDFDYKFAHDQFVKGSCVFHRVLFVIMAVSLACLGIIALKRLFRPVLQRPLIPLYKTSEEYSSSTISSQVLTHDSVPELSHSNSTTPASSPFIPQSATLVSTSNLFTFIEDQSHSKRNWSPIGRCFISHHNCHHPPTLPASILHSLLPHNSANTVSIFVIPEKHLCSTQSYHWYPHYSF